MEPAQPSNNDRMMKIVNELCDCMLNTTRRTCKIYQVIYIVILVALLCVTFMYRLVKRKMLEVKAQKSQQSPETPYPSPAIHNGLQESSHSPISTYRGSVQRTRQEKA